MKNESSIKADKDGGGQFSRRIGSTTYLVSIHFGGTDKETFEEKILRLIESEVRKTA